MGYIFPSGTQVENIFKENIYSLLFYEFKTFPESEYMKPQRLQKLKLIRYGTIRVI